MPEEKTYLGDGLYGVFDGFGIELRANDPDSPTDKVYLDPNTAASLIAFIKRFYEIK